MFILLVYANFANYIMVGLRDEKPLSFVLYPKGKNLKGSQNEFCWIEIYRPFCQRMDRVLPKAGKVLNALTKKIFNVEAVPKVGNYKIS